MQGWTTRVPCGLDPAQRRDDEPARPHPAEAARQPGVHTARRARHARGVGADRRRPVRHGRPLRAAPSSSSTRGVISVTTGSAAVVSRLPLPPPLTSGTGATSRTAATTAARRSATCATAARCIARTPAPSSGFGGPVADAGDVALVAHHAGELEARAARRSRARAPAPAPASARATASARSAARPPASSRLVSKSGMHRRARGARRRSGRAARRCRSSAPAGRRRRARRARARSVVG